MTTKFDELTGFATKELFYENVKNAVLANPLERHCIVYFDIDNFKIFNDLFGYENGDRLLKESAHLIKELNGNKNLCSRITSDWFAFYIPERKFSETALTDISDSLNKIFKESLMPIVIHFGVYSFNSLDEKVSILAGRAKRALKSIKGLPSKLVAYYDNKFMETERQEQHVARVFDTALKNGEFRIFLQPQVSAKKGLQGAEVLARWITPQGELISPDKFIGTLEKTGLISKLDNNIWEQAAALLKYWEGTEKENLYLSVNISVKDFNNLDVYQVLTDIVKKYNIPPKKLRLEITESVLMNDVKKVLEVIKKLRKAGFYIEIDDFGKGYSSLSMLKDIEVDLLKIDMDFLRKTENELKSSIILESIISMTRKLGLEVLTEGVETEAQIDFLKMVGCDLFQGYYYAKPMAVADFSRKFFSPNLHSLQGEEKTVV